MIFRKSQDFTGGIHETEFDVGNLAKGIYTVRASSNSVNVSKRIVVMR
jgi:hypothetical protein